jgi:hypothetical protein
MPSVPRPTVEADRAALGCCAFDVEAPDAVVGVGLGAVDQGGAVASRNRPALRGQVNTVDEERPVVEETAFLEPGERRRAVGDL